MEQIEVIDPMDDSYTDVSVTEDIRFLIDKFGTPIGCGSTRIVFRMSEGSVFKYDRRGLDNARELNLYRPDSFMIPVKEVMVGEIKGLEVPFCSEVERLFGPNYPQIELTPGNPRPGLTDIEPLDDFQLGLWRDEWWLIDYAMGWCHDEDVWDELLSEMNS